MLTACERERLEEGLKVSEGWRSHVYQDSKGYWTIGYGFLVDERRGGGITREEGHYLLRNRIRWCEEELADHRWTRGLDPVRYTVIVELAYNMGVPSLLTFQRMIAAIRRDDWDTAADELLDSKWAREDVGKNRSTRLSAMLSSGEWPEE